MLNKVSIIVPVYKAENSIRKCIDSILTQTYREIELILVDDGSPDRSGQICDKYQSDTRVKVIHTLNKGVSHARNIGLDHATGDYITFCDSDDFYEPFFIENMVQTALRYNSDITICGYYLEEKHHFES
ncbi:glycosyltransferase family 2 protein, partial [Lactobacillus helveticus]|uniref:glycosyltransferase family 2 protein n=1 Tax=Lactobacillus helveticus TaxID=1587 RepID=UPI001C278EEE